VEGRSKVCTEDQAWAATSVKACIVDRSSRLVVAIQSKDTQAKKIIWILVVTVL
jgi:hypothetical protein